MKSDILCNNLFARLSGIKLLIIELPTPRLAKFAFISSNPPSFILWVLLAFFLTGCDRPSLQATPTPTKTPLSISQIDQQNDDGPQSLNDPQTNDTANNSLVENEQSADSEGAVSALSVDTTSTPRGTSTLLIVATRVPTSNNSAEVRSADNSNVQVEPQKEIVLEITDPTPIPGDRAPFTGLPVDDPTILNRRPMIICINNDAAGRAAHYGLSQADLVYEYIVDGFSVTRLSAFYQSQSVDRVGPVRSARLPNVWMATMYDGALACSGGSDPIRYLLTNEAEFPYLDADRDDPNNSRYFSSLGTDYRTRLQTSTAGLEKWLDGTGQTNNWDREGFVFGADPASSNAGQANIIKIRYPGGGNVEWRYDAGVGAYIRYQAGQKQVDPGTGQPVTATNIVAMVATHTETDIVEDSLGTRSVDIQLYGTGDLRLFRDGVVYEGVWHAYADNPPRWLDLNAQVIPLKPGASWVQVIRNFNEISYQ